MAVRSGRLELQTPRLATFVFERDVCSTYGAGDVFVTMSRKAFHEASGITPLGKEIISRLMISLR